MFTKIRDKYSEKRKRQIVNDAEYVFQIKEKNNELWLTFNSFPVCPMSLFKSEPIETLQTMRELYIKNKIKEKYG